MARISHGGPGTAFTQRGTTTPQRLPRTAPGKNAFHKVLVVEDSPVVRLFLKHALEEPLLHCEVTATADGLEGLRALDRTCFDLIICDLAMPLMDGREFCSLVRSRPCDGLRRIIIFSSDRHFREDPQFRDDPLYAVLAKPAGQAEIQALVLDSLA